MKKSLLGLAALVLALMLPLVALAEVSVTGVMDIKEKYPSFYTALGTYTARTEKGYAVFSPEGKQLSGTYNNVYGRQNGMYYEVTNENGLNTDGLLDHEGKEILPLSYGDIRYVDDNWVLAHVLTASNTDIGEYKDSDGNQFIISSTDVLYQGKIIGRLERADYNGSCHAYASGGYLFIKQASTMGFWLDANFNRVDVTDDSYVSSSEFTDVYRKGVLHNPTQQYAFTEGCPLTANDVSRSVHYNSSNGNLLDLQGNVIARNLPYDSVRYTSGDYLLTYRGGLYGIMGKDGREIVPTTYDDIPYNNGLYPNGYQAVLDEKGRLSYLDVNGNVTASVSYQLSASDYKGYYNNANLVAVSNMGQYIIITATSGELAEKYEDIRTPGTLHRIISVQKDGLWGAIDTYGNTVIPFNHKRALEISTDGTVVMGYDQDGTYRMYYLTYTNDAPVKADPAPADGSWTCASCGASCTAKFCPECGATKPAPAADGSWTCASCGASCTGKFCGECGAAKPADKLVCTSCGYEPADGETPKFCPECGTKF